MREILFRGKRTDNGEWAEGYITCKPSAVHYEGYSPWFIEKPPRDPDDQGTLSRVIPETIGEYTGLKDKNGKRIFEGDILADRYGDKGVVTANIYNCGCCHRVYGFSICYTDGEPTDALEFEYSKVIGNIHDNPELLNTNDEREV